MAPIALDAYLHGPLRIVDALDAGLVKTVLEGMQFDARTKADGEGGNSPPLSDTFARILELVSLYMVYPFVRRRFTRSIVSIEESGLEDKLFHGTGKEYGSKFQTLWVKCKESAKTFGDSSDSATEFWSMCANVACPRKQLDWPIGRLAYKRSSSCWQRIYCSLRVQRKSGKKHREKYLILTEAMKGES
ncbi:hypothetical protein WG66_013808 [Moniliophthora roreri]|uniref:Uncharacterized protein n=1 Tax=Moniliophthora roreri TaxID=221103 RepID=A0A0W0G4W2_MONRR|nr:hypothetical protein WG66_013808 [Moniliophthora roreri]